MGQFLMVFYVIFFATGFMGGAALVLLNVRMGGSRLLRPLLLFQVLFLIGMGLIILFFSLPVPPTHSPSLPQGVLLSAINATNSAIWVVVVVLIRRVTPRSGRRSRLPDLAEILAGLVALKSLANVVVTTAVPALAASGAWNLGGHVLSATAMAAFGMVLHGSAAQPESPQLSPLLRAYGILAVVFAPIGLIEYAVEAAEISWLGSISLDHFFYLAWNVVSMGVALRLFGTAGAIPAAVEEPPEVRARALGLSEREAEIAVLIARGLTNKEIGAELFISAGTVRTHVYNLYRKVGVGNRVELVNVLRQERRVDV
ncbi:MAG TPA: response regulator transcription factor [Spirochaetia bacterium]|nr:response regulator transcription factor [Spirochaetia bacterium]